MEQCAFKCQDKALQTFNQNVHPTEELGNLKKQIKYRKATYKSSWKNKPNLGTIDSEGRELAKFIHPFMFSMRLL